VLFCECGSSDIVRVKGERGKEKGRDEVSLTMFIPYFISLIMNFKK